MVDGVEVHRSTGNVFADLDLPDAAELQLKTSLIVEIRRAIKRQGLTQAQAARRTGLPQPRLSALLNGQFDSISDKKLMECLAALGYDIEIRARPSVGDHGAVTFALETVA
jgi:predicted XRE-type DNA-binding protein